ncbi:MAG: apolipoprotein N-acyltransferase [Planctomycetes bacterium]|nr:apolipoprotein N-acyltransferase [Planctomycetota bacterium]
MKRKEQTTWASCLVAGGLHAAMTVLAFPPYDWWYLSFVAYTPLILLALRARTLMRPFLVVWLTSALGWMVIQNWMAGVAIFGYPLMALYQGFWPALFVVLLARLAPQAKRELSRRRAHADAGVMRGHAAGAYASHKAVPAVLLAPLICVTIEFFRGRLFLGGYPWYFVGHPLINAPTLCQIADLFGAYGVSFFACACAALPADLVTLPLARRGRTSGVAKASFGLFGFVLVIWVGYGLMHMRSRPLQTSFPESARTIFIAAVQTNLPQNNKMRWTLPQQKDDFDHFVSITQAWAGKRPSDGRQPDLVVWPETMVPGLGLNQESLTTVAQFEESERLLVTGQAGYSGLYFNRRLEEVARDNLGVPLLVGASAVDGLAISAESSQDPELGPVIRIDPKWDTQYNSSYLYLPDGTQATARYDKLVPTPIGERIPILYRWPKLQTLVGKIGSASSFNVSMGIGTAAVRHQVPTASAGTVRVATPICYESTVPRLCRRLVWSRGTGEDDQKDSDRMTRAADVLINMTNDGWFGNHAGGREQHLQMGRFRCIENRTPMIRAANTGVSAAIDAAGRLIEAGPTVPTGRADWNAEGVLFAEVALPDIEAGTAPLYARVGDLFAWLCLLTIVVWTAGKFVLGR